MDKRDHAALKKVLRRHKRLIQALTESRKQVRKLWRNCLGQHRDESATDLVKDSVPKGRIIH